MKEENAKVLNLNRRQLKTLIRILKTKTYVKNYRNLLKSNSFFKGHTRGMWRFSGQGSN